MTDQMRNKLGAYLDGELNQPGQARVEAHLKTCQSCRDELEELQQLSHLLRSAPQPDLMPVLEFKAQLMLQLPRRQVEAPQPRKKAYPLLWLAPALVLGVWIFFQVAVVLTQLLSLVHQAGLLNGEVAWINSAPQQTQWFTLTQAWIGGVLSPVEGNSLKVFNDASLFVQNLILPLLWQVGAAVLYFGALALVWHYKVQALWPSSTTE